MQLVEQLADAGQMTYLLYGRGLNAFARGDWGTARALFERAAALVGSTGSFWYATYPPHGLGLLALAEGQEAEGLRLLNEATTLAERNHDMQALGWVQGALAEYDLLMGRPVSARDHLAPLFASLGQSVGYFKESLPLLAWAYLELGELSHAESLSEQLLAEARASRLRPTLAGALRVQALLLARQQRWEEAEAALEEALTLCRQMSIPYAEAKTLYLFGQVCRQRCAPALAREHLMNAQAILEKLGERLYARQVEQILGERERQ